LLALSGKEIVKRGPSGDVASMCAPDGKSRTAKNGIVAAKANSHVLFSLDRFIETDSAIVVSEARA